MGKRLVWSSETDRGHPLAEGRSKDITGGDRLRANFMRQNDFEFEPRFKLVITGNHAPTIENCTDAIRGRFCVIPFDQSFTGDAQDKSLDEKLKAELPGIFQWLIVGCLDWQRNGLVIPEKVRVATDAYFDRQDVFAHWLSQETLRDAEQEDTSTRLFKSWAVFAKDNGEDVGSQKALAERLQQAGFSGPHPTTRDGKPVRVWRGLKAVMQ
jgi:putative DNA primase/helicase